MEKEDKSILVGVIIILVVAIILWMVFSDGSVDESIEVDVESDDTTTSNEGPTMLEKNEVVVVENPKVTDPEPVKISNRGNNFCTFETTEDGVYTVTTSFISGAKSRVEVVSRDGGPGGAISVQLNTVSDGVNSYTWTTGSSVGVMESVSGNGLTIPQSSGGAVLVSDDSIASWNCRPWIPEPEELVPPNYVTFN